MQEFKLAGQRSPMTTGNGQNCLQLKKFTLSISPWGWRFRAVVTV